MKIEKVIKMASLMEPGNVLPEELAIALLSEFDGLIQSEILLVAPEDIVEYSSKDQELTLHRPHDGLYIDFLVAMIRRQQQEYEGYENAQAIVNEKLSTFHEWYSHHYHRPGDRSYIGGGSGGAYGFAYLSAYGTAVKLGFVGTEAEWLESLVGQTGRPALMRYDAGTKMIQWSNDGSTWIDLLSLAELIDPVTGAVLEEVRKAAEEAKAAAEEAKDAADRAKGPLNKLVLETAREDGNTGVELWPEGTEEAPALTLYGLGGSGAVKLNNVADAEDERSAVNLGQVKRMMEEMPVGIRAMAEIVDGIEVVTAMAGAVEVTTVDGIETIR